MKNLQTNFVAAISAAILSLAISASADSVKAGYATVVRVQGLASYTLGNGEKHPLIAGKVLPAGATIYTGDNGIVDIVLGQEIDFPQSSKTPDRISAAPDASVRGLISYTPSAQQNVIRLNFETTLTIDKLSATSADSDTVGDTELDLQKGRIFASVKKESPTTEYIVKLPHGVAGIRGTKCSISADGVVAVFESTTSGVMVSLTDANGNAQTFLVAPGHMLDLGQNGEPIVLPPNLFIVLSGVFNNIQTTYYVSVTTASNGTTTVYVSSTSGKLSTDQQ
jgi:hypothetical protein